ncbi:hypothetical protein KS876_003310 [Vibrio parahaemolyticus]|nr:hypothetical protein [Vibrio parahaemolyticus]ELA9434352.1 hypothetical protein [Vibrio parahaemolyticus]
MIFEFDIDEGLCDFFFSPIRKREDVIRVLFKAIQHINIYSYITVTNPSGKMVVNVNKMSRLSFYCDDKYYSINFPFRVVDGRNGSLEVISSALGTIDSVTINNVLSLIEDDSSFYKGCVSFFADEVMDITASNSGFWQLLKDVFMTECGYLRYDYDEKNANGRAHPLHHLDIHYGNSSTFKVGLNKRIEPELFIDILDVTTDSHYLDC